MLRFLAARGRAAAACVYVVVLGPAYGRAVVAQTWNDPRSLTLVAVATQRRAEQLADTGSPISGLPPMVRDFLAQLEGFARPRSSKPTSWRWKSTARAPPEQGGSWAGATRSAPYRDIAYHRDLASSEQLPNIIHREGDEVADAASAVAGRFHEYDFALTDSFAIGAGAQRINVYG
jgi:hypothetical protein